MDENAIRRYFLDFYEMPFPHVIPRNFKFYGGKRPQIIIGPRRIGKTYLLFQRMHELVENKRIRKSQIIYLNFEDIAFSEFTVKDTSHLLEIYWSLFPNELDEPLFVFIDEPQVIENWEKVILSLMKYDFPIYITGSSSKLLSSEVATAFRGRSTSYFFYSLSFDEFLRFRGFKPKKSMSTKESANLHSLFEEYIEYGGYPEVVLQPEIYKKQKILADYYDAIIYRDLLERYKLKNSFLVKHFLKTLINNNGKSISISKIYKNFSSQGIKTSPDMLYQLLNILQETGIFYLVYRYDLSYRREMNSKPKIYLHDLGLFSIISGGDPSIRYENLVFLQLQRQITQNPFMTIGYWKSIKREEIDFIVRNRDKIKEVIQVSVDISKPETKDREISSLLKGINEINTITGISLNSGTIITQNPHQDSIHELGVKIRLKSLEKWLL
ncbi:MAG: ATP-binding protein, partial [Promethearchaeota archaeon]